MDQGLKQEGLGAGNRNADRFIAWLLCEGVRFK